jgi:hypothetical protein
VSIYHLHIPRTSGIYIKNNVIPHLISNGVEHFISNRSRIDVEKIKQSKFVGGHFGLMPLDYIIFSLSTRFGLIGFIDEKLSTYRLHDNNYWSSKNPTFTENVRDTKDFINRFSPFDFG